MALALAGIDRATKDPPGGVYRRDGSGEPTGVIEEAMGRVTRLIPPTTLEQRQQAARAAERDYIAKGVTTTVVAGGSRQEYPGVRLRIHQMLSPGNKLPPPPATVKLFQDGSIQGLTGFLSAPYHSPAGQPARGDYRGYPARPRDSLAKTVRDLHVGGYQIAIHGNGDAAIDDILAAFEAAQREFPRPDSRHRIEHCQTAREDQLDTMRRLGVTPSFFVGHVYYWGDRHRDLFLGPARAARISPLASAARRGIRYTIHNDTPVTPVDPLLLVWCAVNRRTRGGDVLGPDQRVPVADALRSVTIDAAWQNFQERERGSIEVGKLADLVLLGENPLTVAPDRIKDIAVDEVVIGGVKR
jgi:predicted amidohydrolase YtcJ